MEENKSLIAAEKLNQVAELLKEVSELELPQTPFIFISTLPRPDKGEDVGQLLSAIYGNGANLSKSIRLAMRENDGVSEVLKKAVNVNPIEAMLMDFVEAMEDGQPCDCPQCTEDRKNNPNVN